MTVNLNGSTDIPSLRTVLVVDDHEETRDVLCQVLRRDGYRCVSAQDGAEAVQAFRESDIQVALIDHDLPDATGTQLVRAFKLERPNVPILLMTGNPSQDVVFEACDAGASAYLRKPLDLQRLRDWLRNAATTTHNEYRISVSQVEVKRQSAWMRWGRWVIRRK